MAKKAKSSHLSRMMKMGVTNLVGVGMIGATANMTNALPSGTAKTIAGNVPALQSAALVGYNIKSISGKRKGKNKLW